jgi:hypothetical protein
MLQRIREWLTVALLFLLPLHALLVTVGTKLLVGPGHAPLTSFALWKEVVLAVIVLIALIEIFLGRTRRDPWSLDVIDWTILAGIVLAAVIALSPVSAAQSGGFLALLKLHLSASDKQFLMGFKYDFLPLCVFLVLRRVSWSEAFFRRATMGIVGVAALVAVYGLITWALPMSFFTALGYSDLHSLYVASGPLAPFQQVEGTMIRRLQSTMSGPNQLGLWLLIPFSMVLVQLVGREAGSGKREAVSIVILLLLLAALLFTFSRAAWIAAFVILCFVVLPPIIRRARTSVTMRMSLILGILAIIVIGNLGMVFAPKIFVRSQSFVGHLEKPKEALVTIAAHPFGLGLGTAGPASNLQSDTCVFLPLGSDYSWAKDRTDICVFVGGTRRIPAGKACNCPLLTENWYLQWGVEMGWAGLVLSVLLAFLVLRRLAGELKIAEAMQVKQLSIINYQLSIFLAFLGIALAGLFLHSFEDGAVAYTVWTLISAGLSYGNGKS